MTRKLAFLTIILIATAALFGCGGNDPASADQTTRGGGTLGSGNKTNGGGWGSTGGGID